jgi:predicted nuclease with TOPRIM domain
MELYGKYFCGNEISAYGQEHNRLDYGTLSKAFDAVMSNDLMNQTAEIGYWEQESGYIDNSERIDEIDEEIDEKTEALEEIEAEDTPDGEKIDAIKAEIASLEEEKEELEAEQDEQPEVFQWFIVSNSGAEILKEINEIVYYNDVLDLYLWGVTHWGTSWDYVLTDVPCNVANN